MMTKTDKKKWLAALRSGKYKQIKNILKTGDSFCCLGLLCEISPKKAIQSNRISVFDDKNGKNIDGFFNNNPFGITKQLAATLVKMNDKEGRDFKQIASYISRNVKTK